MTFAHRIVGCAAVVATTVAVCLWAGPAGAYCRTAVCGEEVGKVCEPAQSNDCGIPIFWPSTCIGFSVQRDASAEVSLAATRELVAQAFEAWSNADCGNGTPSIVASDLGPVSCTEQTFDSETKNANLIVFRDDNWQYGKSALALTTVTYALDTGEIRDADIELNSENAAFTVTDTDVEVDLLSILTHEAGHFLGLAHTNVADATMQEDYPPRSLTLRSLEPDDVSAICAVYPPDREGACEAEPLNGLGDECDEAASPDDGCECAAPGKPASSPVWVGLAAMALAAFVLRRERAR